MNSSVTVSSIFSYCHFALTQVSFSILIVFPVGQSLNNFSQLSLPYPPGIHHIKLHNLICLVSRAPMLAKLFCAQWSLWDQGGLESATAPCADGTHSATTSCSSFPWFFPTSGTDLQIIHQTLLFYHRGYQRIFWAGRAPLSC